MSIEGNKPRKYVKKLNLHNPTLNSFHVFSLFNPQIYQGYVQQHPLSYRVKNNDETLLKAQAQFQNSRGSQKSLQHKEKQKNRAQSLMQKPSGRSLQENSNLAQVGQYYEQNISHRNLNYLNSESIKRKQLHGYNILSGF